MSTAHGLRAIIFSLVLAAISVTNLSAASLQLTTPGLTASPGQTTGWGFTLEGDSDYWLVVTSVQSTFAGGGAGLSATDPAVTDYLSAWFFNNSFALAPNATLTQSFVLGLTGLGSIELRPDLALGAFESGEFFITYDLYDGDPNQGSAQIFPTSDPGFLLVEGSVTVASAEVPEPSMGLLVAGGLLGLAAWRKRWTVSRLGLFAVISMAGWGQSQCHLASTNVAIRPEGNTELTGDVIIACPPSLVSGPVNVRVEVLPLVSITNRLVDPVAGKIDALVKGMSDVQGFLVSGSRNIVEFPGVVFGYAGADLGITITGIRIAANTFTGGLTFVTANVTVTTVTGTVLPLTYNPSMVGTVLPRSLEISLRDNLANTISTVDLKQCEGTNTVLAAAPTSGSPVGPTFNVRAAENFSNVLRNREREGFGAKTGTRIRLLFENVPAGVQLFSKVQVAPSPLPFPTYQSELKMIDQDNTLSGASVDPLPLVSPSNPAAGGIRALKSMGNQKFMGVWENVGDGVTVVEDFNIPIYAAFQPFAVQGTLPASIKLTASLAPANDDTSPGSDIIPRFAPVGASFTPINIVSCACPVKMLSRLSMKSGALTNRTWTMVVTNASAVPVTDGKLTPQISLTAGIGTATLLSPGSITLPTVPANGSIQVAIPIAFSGTAANSRFTLKTTLTGGCFTGTASIVNQAP